MRANHSDPFAPRAARYFRAPERSILNSTLDTHWHSLSFGRLTSDLTQPRADGHDTGVSRGPYFVLVARSQLSVPTLRLGLWLNSEYSYSQPAPSLPAHRQLKRRRWTPRTLSPNMGSPSLAPTLRAKKVRHRQQSRQVHQLRVALLRNELQPKLRKSRRNRSGTRPVKEHEKLTTKTQRAQRLDSGKNRLFPACMASGHTDPK